MHKALQRLLCLIMSGLLGVVLTQSNGYAEGPPLADKQREIEAKLELVLKQLAYTDAQVRALSTEVQQLRSQLQHAQAVTLPYDGLNPLPPQYCYLKPHYLDVQTSYFEHVAQGAL